MKFLVTILTTSSFIYLVFEATKLFDDTRCRQKAWRISTEQITGRLLSQSLSRGSDRNCSLQIYPSLTGVTWSRGKKLHRFELSLKGRL
jgi:hypothetical protein